MQAFVVSSNEYLYPDLFSYQSAAPGARLSRARGSYANFQVMLQDVSENAPVSVWFAGGVSEFAWESYELVSVLVTERSPRNPCEMRPSFPVRRPPFRVYDCCKPLKEALCPLDSVAALYFSAPVPKDFAPGMLSGSLVLKVGCDTAEIPIQIEVFKAVVPEETLKQLNTYHDYDAAWFAGIGGSIDPYDKDNAYLKPEYREIERTHFLLQRRMRQRVLCSFPVVPAKKVSEDPALYEFDFSYYEKTIRNALACGFTHIGNRSCIGHRISWKKPTLMVNAGKERLPAMGYDAYAFLSQYLPALQGFLDKNGWSDIYYQSVSDEPNDFNATEYRALCGLIRKLAPGLKLMDAQSHTQVYGACDVYIPLNSEYDLHREKFERMRSNGGELWDYTCCEPRRNGYINRFLDQPLLATRYLFWGNYLNDLPGFLHWGWMSIAHDQDPFEDTARTLISVDGVRHTLPAGDSHIVYPHGMDLWMSMRLEATRESAEDYELLRVLEKADKKKADAICRECFVSFNEVVYNADRFERAHIALLEAVSKL